VYHSPSSSPHVCSVGRVWCVLYRYLNAPNVKTFCPLKIQYKSAIFGTIVSTLLLYEWSSWKYPGAICKEEIYVVELLLLICG
jgi:hypothetical protein